MGSPKKILYLPGKLLKFARDYLTSTRFKLERKLILPFTLTIIILLTVVAYVAFKSISSMIISNTTIGTQELIKQTAKNIDIVYSEIDKLTQRISRDEKITSLLERYSQLDQSTKLKNRNLIERLMKDYINTNVEFADVYIFTDEYVFSISDGVGNEFFNSYPVKKFKGANRNSLWLDTYESDHSYTKQASPRVISLLKSMYTASSLKSVGTLLININDVHLYNLLQDVKVSNNGKILITGTKGTIVMDPEDPGRNGQVLTDKFLSQIPNQESGYIKTEFHNSESLITFCNLKRTGWKVIGIIDEDNITENIKNISFRIFLILAICFIIGSILSGIISYKTSRYLERLVVDRTEQLQDALETIKKAQHELVQSEKMASLGILVAGVAHEINTPVGVGVTAASYLNTKTKEFIGILRAKTIKMSDIENFSSLMEETADVLLRNLQRASELIKSFKQVAVDQAVEEKRSFFIKQYMDEIILSLKPTIKKANLNFIIHCEENVQIKTYAGSFAQIITNLVMNSFIHAFDGREGTITIDASIKESKLLLVYSDNGKGMEKETLHKIFDPFFTTKRGQGGTGLGMYIVYNIISQKLGGTIECQSQLGKGTIFTVEFPFDKA
ncbi:MAG: sensor histidine kinase [Clostridia bacterium]|nr:sensor histidine kinase [Clostridia bacterium]